MDQREEAERAAVVAAARGWLRTPWRHSAAVRGAGIDCARLLVEVYADAGLIDRFGPEHYPCDWHMHRREERFLAIVGQHAARVGNSDAPIRERGRDFSVLPGNVLIWKHGLTFSHAAIVSEWPMIIHASYPARCCLEESVMGGELERKAMLVYSRWGR